MSIDVSIAVYCYKCNSYLGTHSFDPETTDSIDVDPCDSCIDEGKRSGYEDGLIDGKQEGLRQATKYDI